MREWFSFFCTAGLMLLLFGCGQESVSSSDELFSSSSAVMDISSESDVSSSSSLVETESSSSSEDVSSSSAKFSSSESRSSSSGKMVNKVFLWDGYTDTLGKVETGSPEESSGYWYDFNDLEDGGSSRFIYPSDVKENEYENFFGPLVETYGGIKARVVLGEGYDYPYAGLGFNIWNDDQEGVDVSAWKGICIAYKSTIAFSIELGVEDEATLDYGNYRVLVPESKSYTAIEFSWSKFRIGWGPYPDIEDVLKKVAAIKLKFEGEAGTTGDFLIQKIGSMAQCVSIL